MRSWLQPWPTGSGAATRRLGAALVVSAIGAAIAIPAVFDLELWIVAGLALGGWFAQQWRSRRGGNWVPITLVHVGWAIVAIGAAGAGTDDVLGRRAGVDGDDAHRLRELDIAGGALLRGSR